MTQAQHMLGSSGRVSSRALPRHWPSRARPPRRTRRAPGWRRGRRPRAPRRAAPRRARAAGRPRQERRPPRRRRLPPPARRPPHAPARLCVGFHGRQGFWKANRAVTQQACRHAPPPGVTWTSRSCPDMHACIHVPPCPAGRRPGRAACQGTHAAQPARDSLTCATRCADLRRRACT